MQATESTTAVAAVAYWISPGLLGLSVSHCHSALPYLDRRRRQRKSHLRRVARQGEIRVGVSSDALNSVAVDGGLRSSRCETIETREAHLRRTKEEAPSNTDVNISSDFSPG